MTLECRIPISPRPAWFNRVRLMAASIRQFCPDAIVQATIGQAGGPTPDLIAKASAELPGIDIEWIGAAEFDAWAGTRSEYIATMNRRFSLPVRGSHVLILDADVVCTGRFDALFDTDAVQGVQAYAAPMDNPAWSKLFAGFGTAPQVFDCPYTGAGIVGPEGECGPWYVNSGVVFAPRHLFERLCEPYQEAIAFLRNTMSDTYWFDQLALALATAKSGVPTRSLPLRYNFPNLAAFDTAHPTELVDVRFIHYLGTDTVHRDHDFETRDAACRLVERDDLAGSNAQLQQRVGELMAQVWPPQAVI